jgi:hypothetical protein
LHNLLFSTPIAFSFSLLLTLTLFMVDFAPNLTPLTTESSFFVVLGLLGTQLAHRSGLRPRLSDTKSITYCPYVFPGALLEIHPEVFIRASYKCIHFSRK